MSTTPLVENEAMNGRAQRQLRRAPHGADRAYRMAGTSAAGVTLVVLVLIGFYLLREGWPVLEQEGTSFFTTSVWTQSGPFGVLGVLWWTVVIAAIALVIAVPLSLGMALYLTEYANARLRRPLTTLVDLLAAVPSLVYGLWGLSFLQPRLVPISRWLSDHLDWIPIFKVSSPTFKASAFVAGVVVAIMIVPTITSIMREVFSQTPPGEKEAALALGGRRWGMIREVVLPFGRGGIIGGSMLGLGRALGETIAVVLIISPVFEIHPRILETGANSVAALITLRLGEAQGIAVNALMAAGLALFAMTLVVNLLASSVVARSRSGKGVDL